jgi:hypothetical protein
LLKQGPLPSVVSTTLRSAPAATAGPPPGIAARRFKQSPAHACASNAGIIRLMPIDPSNLVGYAAAILTTVAFFPQVLKSWQTRDLSGVSLTM